jgi:hypothetical protein
MARCVDCTSTDDNLTRAGNLHEARGNIYRFAEYVRSPVHRWTEVEAYAQLESI